ncbi:MAG: hypothetical protein NVS2B8_08310 [Vulcanimicrobiaceae bacterium]
MKLRPFAPTCALVAALFVPSLAARSDAADPPYLKLAQALGTPKLATSFGPKDKSLLGLDFVRDGEDAQRWTKKTTVSILKVPTADTETATRGVIARVRKKLAAAGARVGTFDQSSGSPVNAYFEFTAKAQNDIGIVYSPHAGFVTVAQLETKNGGRIETSDRTALRHVAAGNLP